MTGSFSNRWLMMGSAVLFGFTALSQPYHSNFSDTGNAKLPYCSRVTGRYGIYANNDFLRISSSHTLVVAVSDELDKELEKLGWQDHMAVGAFQICYARDVNPTELSREDRVEIVGFSSIKFVKGAH